MSREVLVGAELGPPTFIALLPPLDVPLAPTSTFAAACLFSECSLQKVYHLQGSNSVLVINCHGVGFHLSRIYACARTMHERYVSYRARPKKRDGITCGCRTREKFNSNTKRPNIVRVEVWLIVVRTWSLRRRALSDSASDSSSSNRSRPTRDPFTPSIVSVACLGIGSPLSKNSPLPVTLVTLMGSGCVITTLQICSFPGTKKTQET